MEIARANNDLHNLLNSIDVPVLMLGTDMAIRRFTPEAQRILGLIPGDAGRPLHDLNLGLDMAELQQVLTRVMADFIPVERLVRVRSGKSYFLRITPYRTSENKVEGAVLTLTLALTDNQRGEAAAGVHPTEFMLVLDNDLHIKTASPSFYRTFRVSPEAVRNRILSRVDHLISFDNPELQRALKEALETTDTIAPFTVELEMEDGKRKKFECRLERIMMAGATMLALSMLAPFTAESAHTKS